MTKKIARGYVRLSGTDSEDSIPTQKNKIRTYCEKRDDIELELIYNDGKGASGWDASRTEYQNMKQAAEEDEFDVLVVRDGSRIGRDKMERLDMFFDLNNKFSVEFHTAAKGYVDPDNPADLLMEVFDASQHDDGKREEIKKAQEQIQQRVEDGMWQGGSPFGTSHGEGPRGLEPNNKFEAVLSLLNAKGRGESHRDALVEAGMENRSPSLVTRTLNNADRLRVYEEIANREGYWFPQLH